MGRTLYQTGSAISLGFVLAFWMTHAPQARSQPAASPRPTSRVYVVSFEGMVEISPAGSAVWRLAVTNQVLSAGDRVRTRENSRLLLNAPGQGPLRFRQLSEFVIQPPPTPGKKSALNLVRGMLYFFHRGKTSDWDITTPTATAATRGTEFTVEALDGRTIVTMVEGTVELSNGQDSITINSHEQGIAELGRPPFKSPALEVSTIIQWCFYYPGVLDPAELGLAAPEEQILADSLRAYRAGDLRGALDAYPAGRQPAGATETVYRAALLLAAGEVRQTETLLNGLVAAPNPPAGTVPPERLAGALRQLIATVKGQTWQPNQAPQAASEWLAESYYEQAHARLEEALKAARQAVGKSPQFAFGWERVAELEFSFGRTDAAVAALERSLALAPRNAQAHALNGFLLAARNKITDAIASFDRAIALDSALGNAWLGRGLCRIRKGDSRGGREDLEFAAILEPRRSVLRSYLAKAYGDQGDFRDATKQLRLAREFDPRDPTVWLYSALLEQQENRINEAVQDLEHSQVLNENRGVYRSRLLLDQDQAVRSANLAGIYRDAGMFDVSVREAARAVNEDYANYSAHLFLANSYNELRDPNQINLRYETPTLSEYLLANLLAPVGAGTLSQAVSQQEYSKLFERDRFGVTSDTEYSSRGAWLEYGAQYGTFRNFSYALEAIYRSDPGQRLNNDFEQRQLSLKVKEQVTPKDSIYVQALQYEATGGDLFQYFDPSSANPGLRTRETQEPLVSVGYHHEWSPGSHTLLLASHVDDTYSVMDPIEPILIVSKVSGDPFAVRPITIQQSYRSRMVLYSAELQQIWQTATHNTVVGGLFQTADFHIQDLQTSPSDLAGVFPDPPQPASSQDFSTGFERLSIYGYHTWTILEPLQVSAGLSYDHLEFPDNFRSAPLSGKRDKDDQASPKGGLVWRPQSNTVVRAAYTRSLAGASLDQSFRLEPTQVAGFNQSFRSIIPESVAGANADARFETYGVSLERNLPTGTYLAVAGELLFSDVKRTVGAFDLDLDVSDFALPSGLREHLKFRERSLLVTLNQLLGRQWAVGARYRLSQAELHDDFPQISDTVHTFPNFTNRSDAQALLHQLDLRLLYNHPSGFFSQLEGQWYAQNSSGYTPELPKADFWQLNAFLGYRFPGRRAELSIGVLNLTDQDYRLNPLNLNNELPRRRLLVTRVQLSF